MIEDGVSGRLVPAGNAKALADAMRELISSPTARERMGRRALELSRRFTSDSVVPQLLRIYSSLVEESTAGGVRPAGSTKGSTPWAPGMSG